MSVATTYAEALYEAAADAGSVDAVSADLSAFAGAAEESDELRSVLVNPQIDTGAKKAAVGALAEGADPLVVNFLQVLIDRGRIHDLGEVARAFQERVARAQDRLEVEAVTAIPLPDDLRARIVTRLEEKTGNSITLSESVDPDIVGGLVLRVGGVVVDGSLRSRLDGLGDALRNAPVDAATAS